MRLTPIMFAVASLTAAAFSSSASAYCRGCATSPEAAAAAAAGAIYGSAIAAGAAAQARAYEPPPPMPNSGATYGAANTNAKDPDCKNPTSRTFVAGSDIPAARIDKCE